MKTSFIKTAAALAIVGTFGFAQAQSTSQSGDQLIAQSGTSGSTTPGVNQNRVPDDRNSNRGAISPGVGPAGNTGTMGTTGTTGTTGGTMGSGSTMGGTTGGTMGSTGGSTGMSSGSGSTNMGTGNSMRMGNERGMRSDRN